MKKNLIKGAVLALSLTLTMGLFAGCGGSGGDNGDAERTDEGGHRRGLRYPPSF